MVWLFDREDESLARELLRFSAVLEQMGMVANWSLNDIFSGQDVQAETARQVSHADVVMILLSADLLARESTMALIQEIRRSRRARLVPVLLRATVLPPELSDLQVLPRDGRPIAARRDRDEALLEVIKGLQEILTFGRSPPVATPSPAPVTSSLTINDIFRLNGPPTVTFVEPPRFGELVLELRTMGTGLIVEGPSKVGKSTAVKKAMEALGVPPERQLWWKGQQPPQLDEFGEKLDELIAARENFWLFIDDFHYLEDERFRRLLAFRMKALADLDQPHGKVTVIGINPLGDSLAQAMPDLAGRFRILRIDREKDWARSTKIAELIIQGERAANIRFTRRDEFVLAADGSFFIAQLLCNRAAAQAGVYTPGPTTVRLELGPTDVVDGIRDELAARYRAPMLEFAAYDENPPPRGAGLSLLWLLSRSADGFASIKEARLRFPNILPAFDWYLASNLSRCFEKHPSLKGLLYFNRATGTLTMEDPQLKFYLRQLDWENFAEATGHGHVSFHPEDGPQWPTTIPAAVGLATEAMAAAGGERSGRMAGQTNMGGQLDAIVTKARRILHLSDLHFATADQATIAYSQLATDLRQQGFETLDALLVTGDLANRATPTEYEAARMFLEQVMTGFSLAPRKVMLVPGNHDVSWPHSESAYSLHKRSRYTGALAAGGFIEHSSEVSRCAMRMPTDGASSRSPRSTAACSARSTRSTTRPRASSPSSRRSGSPCWDSIRHGRQTTIFATAPASTRGRWLPRCCPSRSLPPIRRCAWPCFTTPSTAARTRAFATPRSSSSWL